MTHDIPPYLRFWLDETLAEAPKPDRVIQAVTTAVHHTPQLRGWLPLLGTRRSQTMFGVIKVATTGALVIALGGALLIAQPFGEPGPDTPGAAEPADSAAPTTALSGRSSVLWGTKLVRYTPPSGWPLERVQFGVHDVARVMTGCGDVPVGLDGRPDPTFAAVGPTAEDLTDALMNQTWLERSGPKDFLVSGYPAKRFILINNEAPPCHWSETSIGLWTDTGQANNPRAGFMMLGGGYAIVIVADVEGERLVLAALEQGHPIEEKTMPDLEADADALIASMEIVDADPMRAAWVTGTCPYSGTRVGSPTVTVEDGVTKTYGEHWKDFRPCDMSDPRLIGTGTNIYNTHTYPVEGDDPIVVQSTTYRIENEAGSWEYTGAPGLARGPGTLDTVTDTGVFVGSGAYEGLTAYLVFDYSRNPVTVVGAIFPGELPPIPTLE
jgi:hypothetical protein